MSSPQFPEPPTPIAPTPLAEVDAKLERLAAHKKAWLGVGIPKRIEYLKSVLAGVREVGQAWVDDGCRRKGIAPGSPLAGEEWLAGPATTARNARLLVESLTAGGRPKPAELRERKGGQLVARVFPEGLRDKMMFGGVSAEVWVERGKPPTQGAAYGEAARGGAGKVALVLGAGNVSSIPPMDALYKLFAENEVVIVKMNPVNADAGPHIERAFHALIDDGFLAVVYGGAEVGAHLANHPLVDTLHVTGSDKTYDAIVWGPDGAERARRKAAHDPVNRRPFTAELGCVTPVFIVPGPWSSGEIAFQAKHVAAMVAQNASFNCNAAKVLVTAEGWPQRQAFLNEVEKVLAGTAPRKAYYPGAQDRYQGFLDHYPHAKALGERSGDVVPWTIIADVAPNASEYALHTEAFCGVLAEVALPATTAADFLEKLVPFGNNECWGTLSTCVLIHPRTEREHAAAFDHAIGGLRYGGIGINVWPGLIYGLASPTWGAFPGHTPEDIQSGAGVVHNTFLFDHPERSVVRAPFIIKPKPAWFADHKTLDRVGQRLTALETEPSWGGVASVAMVALRG